MRARQTALLVLPSLRTMPWPAIVGAAAVAAGLLALPGSDDLLLLGAGIVAASIAFVIEDAADVTIAAVPLRLLARRLVRLGTALPIVGALWALVVWRGDADGAVATLVLAALAALAAAVAARYGAVAGAMAPPAVIVVAFVLPEQLALFDGSDAATARWFVLLGIAIAAFCAASRDPGRASRWRAPRTLATVGTHSLDNHQLKENGRCSLPEG